MWEKVKANLIVRIFFIFHEVSTGRILMVFRHKISVAQWYQLFEIYNTVGVVFYKKKKKTLGLLLELYRHGVVLLKLNFVQINITKLPDGFFPGAKCDNLAWK